MIEVSIEYPGMDEDMERSWDVIAGKDGGTWTSSGFFFPTNQRDIQWTFANQDMADTFIYKIRLCMKVAKVADDFLCICSYDPEEEDDDRETVHDN